jgi:hypothetical protein
VRSFNQAWIGGPVHRAINLVLTIDARSGDAQISNESAPLIEFDSYTIGSESGSRLGEAPRVSAAPAPTGRQPLLCSILGLFLFTRSRRT